MVAPIHKAMLQHLTCDICFQYLSVLPIKVTKSGMKFCGRCLDVLPNDSAWSIYNRIAKYCAFDCVNRFSGCTAKLEIHEVVSHEKTCVFRNNKCCFCDFQGNWCQIVEHCKRIHPGRVVTKTLQINYNEPNTFLVVVDTNICLVRVRRNVSQKTLYFMEHKSKCSRRPYKCPLQKYDVVVYSTTDLVTHWHCRTPKLISNKIIECDNFDKYEYYLALGTELYHVMINFSEKSISVIIEEANVFPNRIEFRLSGFCTAYKTFYELQLDRIGDKMEYTSNNSSPKGYLMSKLQISFGNLQQ
ncbi:uncharacterized protein LOC132699378 [Cylas formicarius]|uniref:uncharacterized protein LOC132699378 n=1 Tax=Cylas formicarius TaxID=197179 RepID=UPI00295874FE|nr:uncharacterized protein LOC132699378 [Cylas formicarius]